MEGIWTSPRSSTIFITYATSGINIQTFLIKSTLNMILTFNPSTVIRGIKDYPCFFKLYFKTYTRSLPSQSSNSWNSNISGKGMVRIEPTIIRRRSVRVWEALPFRSKIDESFIRSNVCWYILWPAKVWGPGVSILSVLLKSILSLGRGGARSCRTSPSWNKSKLLI
jgi:hypothetical protein